MCDSGNISLEGADLNVTASGKGLIRYSCNGDMLHVSWLWHEIVKVES